MGQFASLRPDAWNINQWLCFSARSRRQVALGEWRLVFHLIFSVEQNFNDNVRLWVCTPRESVAMQQLCTIINRNEFCPNINHQRCHCPKSDGTLSHCDANAINMRRRGSLIVYIDRPLHSQMHAGTSDSGLVYDVDQMQIFVHHLRLRLTIVLKNEIVAFKHCRQIIYNNVCLCMV